MNLPKYDPLNNNQMIQNSKMDETIYNPSFIQVPNSNDSKDSIDFNDFNKPNNSNKPLHFYFPTIQQSSEVAISNTESNFSNSLNTYNLANKSQLSQPVNSLNSLNTINNTKSQIESDPLNNLKKSISNSISQKCSFIVSSKVTISAITIPLDLNLKNLLTHNTVQIYKLESQYTTPSQQDAFLVVNFHELNQVLQDRDRIELYNTLEYTLRNCTIYSMLTTSSIQIIKNREHQIHLKLDFNSHYRVWEVSHSPITIKKPIHQILDKFIDKVQSDRNRNSCIILGVIIDYKSVIFKKCYSITLTLIDESTINDPVLFTFISDFEINLPRVTKVGQICIIDGASRRKGRDSIQYKAFGESKYFIIDPDSNIEESSHLPSIKYRIKQLQTLSILLMNSIGAKNIFSKYQKKIEYIKFQQNISSDLIGIVENLHKDNNFKFTLNDGTGLLQVFIQKDTPIYRYLNLHLEERSFIKIRNVQVANIDEVYLCNLGAYSSVSILPDNHIVSKEIKSYLSIPNINNNLDLYEYTYTEVVLNPISPDVVFLDIEYTTFKILKEKEISRCLVYAKLIDIYPSQQPYCFKFCNSCYTRKIDNNSCICGSAEIIYEFFLQLLLEDIMGEQLIVTLASEDASYFIGIGSGLHDIIQNYVQTKLYKLRNVNEFQNFHLEKINRDKPNWIVTHTRVSYM